MRSSRSFHSPRSLVTDTPSHTTRVPMVLTLLIVVAGCGDTGQDRVDFPIRVEGAAAAPVVTLDGAMVTLDVADVAFGPAVFCATEAASSDLCPKATVEFRDSVRVDTLDPSVLDAGRLSGTTGVVRSSAYDFGIVWFTSQTNPRVTDDAPDGHSARFSGVAQKNGVDVTFTVDVDVKTAIQGQRAVQGQRTSVDVIDDDHELVVLIDPHPWFARVDLAALFVAPSPTTVSLNDDTRVVDALRLAMTVQAPPVFLWRRTK